ncbi:MAG: hypothetical protein VCD00_14830 [Candidatus Hydrogenedentota bacterium]
MTKQEDKKTRLWRFPIPTQRAPLWLRILLMIALLLVAGLGFYLTNAATFERISNR